MKNKLDNMVNGGTTSKPELVKSHSTLIRTLYKDTDNNQQTLKNSLSSQLFHHT
jgi:hypothetical protein